MTATGINVKIRVLLKRGKIGADVKTEKQISLSTGCRLTRCMKSFAIRQRKTLCCPPNSNGVVPMWLSIEICGYLRAPFLFEISTFNCHLAIDLSLRLLSFYRQRCRAARARAPGRPPRVPILYIYIDMIFESLG